jgi:excinuclease UvrABC nuclease subunit
MEMEHAAASERFEEAASLRDQVQALLRMEAPQKITTTDIEERDLFAAHVEGERAAVQVFSVRDGKVVAREGFLLDDLTEPELVLSQTVQQFYATPRYVPREVLVASEIPDCELLQAWLAERRGTNVTIRVPQRGEKLRLLELVVRNARLELSEPPRGDLREDLALSRNRLGHDDVERADAIGSHQQHQVARHFIDVTNLAPAKETEGQVGSSEWHQTRISSSVGIAVDPARIGSITSARNSSTCCGARPT